jgi:hypothetical protein
VILGQDVGPRGPRLAAGSGQAGAHPVAEGLAVHALAGQARLGGLHVVLADGILTNRRSQITELAAKGRLPAMYPQREYAKAGGLMAYSANPLDLARRAAVFVDKILKGAKPADLPIEQPNDPGTWRCSSANTRLTGSLSADAGKPATNGYMLEIACQDG